MSYWSILKPLKFIILFLIMLPVIMLPAIAHEKSHKILVLVTSNNNQIKTLPPSLIRKLFLNIPVTKNKQQLVPLINTSDKLLYEIFLQKIAYMSERSYDRLLISKSFRTGKPRPEKYSNNNDLTKDLKAIRGSVSFMWQSIANKQADIFIIQTLWEDRH